MKTKEFIEKYKEMPDVQDFCNRVMEAINKIVPVEAILEAFDAEVFKDWGLKDTREYRETRNLVRAFSLVFWTEYHDGAEDYTDSEREYMMLFIRYMRIDYPDLDAHKNTRLILPSKN